MMSRSLDWSSVSGSLGAEVSLDLRKPLSDSIKHQLVELFDERQLLVFRDQDIDVEAQMQLAKVFADLIDDPPVSHQSVQAGTLSFITNVVGEDNARGGT